MGTTGINVKLTNKDWELIKVTHLDYYSPDWESGPEPFQGMELRHGESKQLHLEGYNSHNGHSYTLSIKVDDVWTIKVKMDPLAAYKETYVNLKQATKVYDVTVDVGDAAAPPTVYASFSGGKDSNWNVEFVVARQADQLLVHSGELACTSTERRNYKTWLATKPADYYGHYSFQGIPLAKSPPDDRSEGGYNFRRNVEGGQFAKLIADTARWKTGASDTFFHALDTPKGANHKIYTDDEWFGKFPLFGPDPTMIERVDRDDQLPRSLGDGLQRSLHAEIQARNVYRVDYSRYAHLLTGSSDRFACWPMALFIRQSFRGGDNLDHNKLVPVAIELNFPQASPELVSASRNDNQRWTWEMAKRLFLCAAANYHELGAHLARCHLVMERYALATYRNLPPTHPVGRLLRPHFKFLVATDHDAVENLINPGGPVDKNFMVGIEDSLKISADAFKTWDLRTHGSIENDLRRRGVEALHVGYTGWTYSEYGRPIYTAIRDFVRSYLRLWYGKDDQTIRADMALLEWNNALLTEYQVGEQGVPLPSNAHTFENLVTACANIIWTSGPQHSAVNYPQYDFLADATTLPFANYLSKSRPPTMLRPDRDRIEDQAQVTARLAAFRYDKLGHYPEDSSGLSEYGDLGHPHAPWEVVVANFQRALATATKHYRPNPDLLWGYPYLVPENITNGISI